MRVFFLIPLFILTGCATNYVLPGNRFMTPETQGGTFKGQFEVQKTSAEQLRVDVSQGAASRGVKYSEVGKTGYLASTSLMDQVDLYWSHTGSSNSIFGGKFQFLGDSRSGAGSGHKLAGAIGFGGNDYETEDSPAIDFRLTATEIMLLYGYRFDNWIMAYSGLSIGNYDFKGTIKSSDPVLRRLDPHMKTKSAEAFGGLEVTFLRMFGKLEFAYQQLKTTQTAKTSQSHIGLSVGLNW